MRIVALRLAGFGPFRGEQRIDFTAYEPDGLYLISGRTGAGKSSVLDAICFALYGHVPRFEGAHQAVRSQHCAPEDPTFAELDFELRGATYRIRRSPDYERPKARGTGTTLQASQASLSVLEDGRWRVLAAKGKEVGERLAERLPLTQTQFLQVMLLAQNRFQEFLLAKTDDRRRVLRTLFGTRRFEQLEEALVAERRALEQQVADDERTLRLHAATVAGQCGLDEPSEPDVEWFQVAYAGLADRRETAAAEADERIRRHGAAERAHRLADTVRQAQERRRRAADALVLLEAEQPEIDRLALEIDAAGRAAAVRPLIAAERRAADDAANARSRLVEAVEDWERLGGRADVDAAEHARVLSATVGALDAALEEEARRPALEADVTAADHEIARREAEIRACADGLAALPAAVEAVEAQLLAASTTAATRVDRRNAVAALDAALAAARDAERLRRDVDARQRDLLRASEEDRRAAAATDDLLRRRYAGAAADLATLLRAGEPCSVCGATVHPSPAGPSGDQVTDADLRSAKAAATACRERVEAATSALEDARAAFDRASAASGGRTVEALTDDLRAAETAAAEADGAVRLVAASERERARLKEESSALTARLRVAQERRAGAAERRVAATTALQGIAERLAAQRLEFPSVAARRARVVEERDAAGRLAAARDRDALTRQVLADTTTALAEQLAEQRFADRDAAVRALREDTAVESLVRRVRAHDDALARERGVVADAAAERVPDDPVDLTPLTAALETAAAARDEAVAASSALRDRAEQVARRVGEVERLDRRSGQVREQYRQVRELAEVVAGKDPNTRRMRLETYVLASHLEQVIDAANERLQVMTAKRYRLVLDDGRAYRNAEAGLGLGVLDAFTGEQRQPASLSGGEKFLASLSLALGLAEVVSAQAGGLALDTLFVDEGFGSLDADTLDTAMAALEQLRAGGRTIGLISHVDSMKERIAAKLAVEVLPGGGSVVLQDAVPV